VEEEYSWIHQAFAFVIIALGSIVIISLTNWLVPSWIPFKWSAFWEPKGHILDWLYSALPMFIWGTSVSFVYRFFISNEYADDPMEILVGGFGISLFAGISEEILFRWLIFLCLIPIAIIENFFFFGWIGWLTGWNMEWSKWFYENVMAYIVNIASLGYLQPWLYSPLGWYVGAAFVAANAFFRDGHKYQGLFGYLNSWFIGLYLFWLMFQYGLLAAILAHFLYNMLIFLVHFVYALIND
jgi:hypothetical protein